MISSRQERAKKMQLKQRYPSLSALKHLARQGDTDERLEAVKLLKGSPFKGAVRTLIPLLASENECVKSASLAALIEIGERDTAELLSALGSRTWHVRAGTAKVLTRLADNHIPELVRRLDSSNRDVIYWVMKILVAARNRQGIEAVIACLEHHDPLVREYAADFLGHFREKEVINPLIAALFDTEWKVRSTAAQSLTSFGDEVVPAISCTVMGTAPGERYWLLKILEEVADSRSLTALVNVLESPAPEERRLALSALRRLKEEGVIPALVRCLGDEVWAIRKESAETLMEIGPEVTSALLPLLGHQNAHSRCWACKVFAELGDSSVCGKVAKLLKDKEWYVRCAAAYSLGQLGSNDAVGPLLESLDDVSEEVRKSAVIALGNLLDTRAVPALEGALKDENEWVRKYAEESLRKIWVA